MPGEIRQFPPAVQRILRDEHDRFQAVLKAMLRLTECDTIPGAQVLQDFSGVMVPGPGAEEPKA